MSGKSILSYVIMILIVMVGIYAVKKVAAGKNIPLVSAVAEGV
jgi:uncharacterized protein YxeA